MRQGKYNVTLRSNHYCSGKAISITKPECASAAVGIQHAMRMRNIVICGLPPLCIILPHYLVNGTIFEKKKILNTNCVLISSATFV